MNECSDLGDRIRRLRVAHGLTQRQLAEPHYTSAYVSSVESGRRKPSTDALQHFALRLQVDEHELRTGRSALEAGELDANIAERAVELAVGGSTSRAALEQLGADADRLGLDLPAARARLGLVRLALRTGDLFEAVERSGPLVSPATDRVEETRIEALVEHARAVTRSGDPAYAAYLLEDALHELSGDGTTDPTKVATLQAALVPIYLAESGAGQPLGQLFGHGRETDDSVAMSAAGSALAVLPRYENPEELAARYLRSARARLDRGDVAGAGRLLTHTYDVVDLLELRADLAHCHRARAQFAVRNGRDDIAVEELETAADIFRTVGDFGGAVSVAAELCEVHRREGRPEEAERILGEAVTLLRGDDDLAAMAELRRQEGLLALERSTPQRAVDRLGEAAALFDRVDAQSEVAATMRLVGDVLRDQGREVEAAEAYDTGLRALCRPAELMTLT